MATDMPSTLPYGWATSLVNRTAPIMAQITLGLLPGQDLGNGLANALWGNLMDWVGFYAGFTKRAMMIVAGSIPWAAAPDSSFAVMSGSDVGITITSTSGSNRGVKGLVSLIPTGGKLTAIKAKIDTNGTVAVLSITVGSAPVAGVQTTSTWFWSGTSDGSAEVSLAYSAGATGTLDGPCTALVAVSPAVSSSVDFYHIAPVFGAP